MKPFTITKYSSLFSIAKQCFDFTSCPLSLTAELLEVTAELFELT